MYGLPEDFKTAIFHGRSLDLVCFTRYQVDLHLSGKFLISVEAEISLDAGKRFRLPLSLSYIYPLIDQKIVSTSTTVSGTLSLHFEKGKTLCIHDSSEQFESYSISEHGVLIVRV